MKLETIQELTGKIVLHSGLHIGVGGGELHIGGTDSSVVKDARTNYPYIPGSSLKGKIRSLLELHSGLISFTGGAPVSIKTYKNISEDEKQNVLNILQLFGTSAGEDVSDVDGLYTARLSFADCFVSKNCQDGILTEVKAENSINRATGTAISPRFIERVPRGVEFDFVLSIKVYESDDKEKLFSLLKKGLRLLELDCLGGSGSRGYGKIKFENLLLDGQPFELPEKIV